MHTDSSPDRLRFTIEIVDDEGGTRVVARATASSLAHAMFMAACAEYAHVRILLKRSGEIISDSAARRSA